MRHGRGHPENPDNISHTYERGDKAKTEAALKDAADKLLANTVIENYRVELL